VPALMITHIVAFYLLGIHVLVVGRNAERGSKTVDEIRSAGGKAVLFRLIFEMQRAHAPWRRERSNSARGTWIF
jgi:uroporphyrinogen-III synthase